MTPPDRTPPPFRHPADWIIVGACATLLVLIGLSFATLAPDSPEAAAAPPAATVDDRLETLEAEVARLQRLIGLSARHDRAQDERIYEILAVLQYIGFVLDDVLAALDEPTDDVEPATP